MNKVDPFTKDTRKGKVKRREAMTNYLGIDVSKDWLDVVLLREALPTEKGQFDNTHQGFRQLQHFLKKRKVKALHACLEATGYYGAEVALFLHETDYVVSVVNPARIKAYAESQLSRTKTDAGDAALIADFCRTQHPSVWTPPPPEQQELQALVRHLENLQDIRQQELNRRQAGIPSEIILKTLDDHITFLDQQIAELLQLIHDHVERHPHLRQQRDLLTSIPGIGDITAFKLLAEIVDVQSFDSARQLAAFAGLTPRERRSGSSVRGHSRVSKRGSSRLRSALYFPAIVAQTHNPILHVFAQRLRAAGKSKLQVVVAVMRKLLHLVFGILKSGHPFDPHFLDERLASP
jgi:transposase